MTEYQLKQIQIQYYISKYLQLFHTAASEADKVYYKGTSNN